MRRGGAGGPSSAVQKFVETHLRREQDYGGAPFDPMEIDVPVDLAEIHRLFLGDRLETDILGGQQAGLKTIMVTTGVDNEESIAQKGIQPDIIFGGIDELVQQWKGFSVQ